MESHNHPSYIEPYQGAATGVGGILRDVFTMGARPIAAMNALRFGEPDHPKTRHLVAGVVAGIGGYGNSFGVPTVGGEVEFDPRYNGNCLVNAFAAGLAKDRRHLLFRGKGGRATGGLSRRQDRPRRRRRRHHGIGRVRRVRSRKSGRPVQVGDPFTEKCLLEACLELMASGAVIAIQDMGAAGLTCSARGNGRQGRTRHRTRSRPGAGARGEHDRLRDDAVGKPGAHADGAASGNGGDRPGHLRKMGPSTSPSSARPRTTFAFASCMAASSSPTCRSRSSATKPPNTTGRGGRRGSIRRCRPRRSMSRRTTQRRSCISSARPTTAAAAGFTSSTTR